MRKAQSALEFLTTYGWAFLVVLVMIGALAYFGILNPKNILPNKCIFGIEFTCIDHQISATANTLKLKLKNNQGEVISISSITVSSDGATPYSCPTVVPAVPFKMASGNLTDVTLSGCNSAVAGFVAGEKGKATVRLKYYTTSSGSGYGKEVDGEIFTSVI